MNKGNGHKWLAAGTTTFIAEPVLAMAHQGGIGMIVGLVAGAAAYALIDDVEKVTGKSLVLPIPAAQGEQQEKSAMGESGKRSLGYRLLVGKSVRPEKMSQADAPKEEEEPSYPADLEEEDISLSQFDPPVSSGDIPLLERNGLDIAETFRPSAASFCGQCVSICGMRRKGKSNLLTVLAEELAAQRPTPPILLLDTEDEYGPLAHPHYFSRGIAAGAREGAADVAPGVEKYMVVTRANASAFGRAIVEQRLQVVLNLKSYTDEDACFIMEGLVRGIDDWQQERREDTGESRLPVFVFLDEATKWMPQNQGEMRLTPGAKAALYQTFYDIIVRRGGKRGWNLIAAFQKLAEIDKRLLQASYKFIFGQSEPPDLAKCKEMGLNPEVVKTLRPGECFAFCPQREGAMRIQVRRCHSYHVGSTPSFENLLYGEGRVARNLDGVLARFAEPEPAEQEVSPGRDDPSLSVRTTGYREEAPRYTPARSRHAALLIERRRQIPPLVEQRTREPVLFPSSPVEAPKFSQEEVDFALRHWHSGADSIAKLRNRLETVTGGHVTHHYARTICEELERLGKIKLNRPGGNPLMRVNV